MKTYEDLIDLIFLVVENLNIIFWVSMHNSRLKFYSPRKAGKKAEKCFIFQKLLLCIGRWKISLPQNHIVWLIELKVCWLLLHCFNHNNLEKCHQLHSINQNCPTQISKSFLKWDHSFHFTCSKCSLKWWSEVV